MKRLKVCRTCNKKMDINDKGRFCSDDCRKTYQRNRATVIRHEDIEWHSTHNPDLIDLG